ncbi:MAG: gamma-glutamylcyclotransferase [Syntrophales bacterium]|nr:gamma-glutamylcyclotransferase [Syntrophales bacterium]
MKVFVYGTMLRGMPRSVLLMPAKFEGHGRIEGTLHDLGNYPAVIKGGGSVYGELYEVDSEIIREMDEIEGYLPWNEPHSLYTREETHVTMLGDGSLIRAYAYFVKGDVAGSWAISFGDYRRHLVEKVPGRQWYLSFGSNMSSERLKKRIGRHGKTMSGNLEGYSLIFNKKVDGGGVYANISYTGAGHRCPFVAYDLSIDQIYRLDEFEGAGSHYFRICVPFASSRSGPPLMGHLYVANPEKLTNEGSPSADYLQHIYNGYEEHGFDTGGLPSLRS